MNIKGCPGCHEEMEGFDCQVCEIITCEKIQETAAWRVYADHGGIQGLRFFASMLRSGYQCADFYSLYSFVQSLSRALDIGHVHVNSAMNMTWTSGEAFYLSDHIDLHDEVFASDPERLGRHIAAEFKLSFDRWLGQ